MNSLFDFHFYDVCGMAICFSTARSGMAEYGITSEKLVCER